MSTSAHLRSKPLSFTCKRIFDLQNRSRPGRHQIAAVPVDEKLNIVDREMRMAPARRKTRSRTFAPASHRTTTIPARLGSDAGIIGVALPEK